MTTTQDRPTAPPRAAPSRRVPVPKPVRTVWRRLTSMRTALILLFLLALGAVPGSLLPQRPLNPAKTTSYIKDHGAWGRFLDATGMFDVFGSPWFAAIYLLLFISLVGCLIPRIRVHARAVARKPLPAPRNLSRLPENGSFDVGAPPAAYASVARATLGRRWRVAERQEDGGVVTLSAEKGYSRETGNLVFHVALLVALVLIAVGRLFTYEGLVIVQQGAGFCSTSGNYDTWKPGRFAAEGKVKPAPFCIQNVDKFTAAYSSSGEPREFAADVTYHDKALTGPARKATIKVNHPLRLEGDRIYLTGHGYAPTVTVRMPDGRKVTDTENFLPTNAATLYSEGVYKLPGNGSTTDIGISGFFAPTPVDQGNGIISSSSAQVNNPVLGVQVYIGNLNSTGLPESVYSLDTSKMTKIGGFGANLQIGKTATFPNGVQVTFDGWTPWVNLQVSHDPAQGYLLIAALAMVIGLAASLGVRRRRVWLRIGPGDGASTLVRVGGLARSDSGNFSGEFATLLDRLRGAGTTTTERAGSRDVTHAGKD